MLKLYGFSRVNPVARGNTRDLRILWALEEMQVPYELVGMDHPAKALDAPAFRALNPFGQLPVIDDDGVIVTESGAILLYLAKKTRTLIPGDAAGEAQVVRWCFAALSSIEVPVLSHQVLGWMNDRDTRYGKFIDDWVAMRLANLETWLDGRTFIATDDFTVADILMAHVLTHADLAPYPRLAAYRERCRARPSWQRTVERYDARVEAG